MRSVGPYAVASMKKGPFAKKWRMGTIVLLTSLAVGGLTFLASWPILEFIRGIAASTAAVGIGIWLINVLLEKPRQTAEAHMLHRYVQELTWDAETALRMLAERIEGNDGVERLKKVYFYQADAASKPSGEQVVSAVKATRDKILGVLAETSHSHSFLRELADLRRTLAVTALPQVANTARELAIAATTSAPELHTVARALQDEIQRSETSLYMKEHRQSATDHEPVTAGQRTANPRSDRTLCTSTQTLVRGLAQALMRLESWRSQNEALISSRT